MASKGMHMYACMYVLYVCMYVFLCIDYSIFVKVVWALKGNIFGNSKIKSIGKSH